MNQKLGIGLAFAMTFFMASLTIAAKYFPTANVVKATYLSGFLGALATGCRRTGLGIQLKPRLRQRQQPHASPVEYPSARRTPSPPQHPPERKT